MSQKICSNCCWWKDAGIEARYRADYETDIAAVIVGMPVRLGYCEPEFMGYKHHQWGLTAEDYTCSEWSESDE